MNVEIAPEEAPKFPEKEYIKRIFVAVYSTLHCIVINTLL